MAFPLYMGFDYTILCWSEFNHTRFVSLFALNLKPCQNHKLKKKLPGFFLAISQFEYKGN